MKRSLFIFFFTLAYIHLYAQNCTLAVKAVASSGTICAGTASTITAQISGGNAPFKYLWSTGDTTATITVTTAGNYTVNVSDATPGCDPVNASATISNPSFLRVSDRSICGNNATTLTATGADSYQWQDADGNILSTQASYNTPVLNTTTTYYVIGTKAGCSTSPAAVTVNVTPVPDAPTAPGTSVCSGSVATLTATSATGTVFDWYATPTGGTSLITSSDFTTPALTATTTYYVQTYNGSCPGPRTAVTVTVNPIPPAPQAGNQTVCYNSAATLTASASGGTIKWYSTSFGSTPLASGPSFTTPALNASTTFYVANVDDQTGCSSNRLPVIVTVKAQVPHPTAPGTVICTGNTATLTATSTQSGTTFQWYDQDNGGTQLSSNATFTTPALSATTTYYVQGTYDGCASPRTAVTVAVTNVPDLPTLSPINDVCGNNSAVITATGNAANYQWYDTATGKLLFTGNTFVTPVLTATTSFYVIGANGSCAGPRKDFTVNVYATPATPTLTSSSNPICPGDSTTLNVTGSNITWFDSPTGGNAVGGGNSFTTPVLKSTTTYYAESSNGQCTSTRLAVPVTVTFVPDPVFSYTMDAYCTTSGPQTPIVDNRIPQTWHFTASPAVGLTLDPNNGRIIPATSVPGTYTITFTTTANSCITATQKITIGLPGGSAAISYSSAQFCQYDPNPLPIGAIGTVTATPDGLVFTSTKGQIDLTNSTPGTYTVKNTLMCGGTSTSNTTVVTIKPRTTVDAGPDQTVGTGAPVQLAGTKTGSAQVKWTSSGGGTFTPSDGSSLTSVYRPAPGETTATLTLTAADEGNGCPPLSDKMVVNFLPLLPPTSSDAVICEGETAVLTASGSASGDYQWYDAEVGGNLLSVNNPLSVSPKTTTKYYVQTIVNGVTSSRGVGTVSVNASPPVTVSGTTICFDSKATLTASTTTTGGTFQWYDANGILLSTGDTYITPFLQQNTRFFVKYVTTPCSSPLTPVDVTVNPLPTVTSALTAAVCSGTALNYTIQSNVSTATYTWTRAAVNGITNPAANGNTANITETLENNTATPIVVEYDIVASSNTCTSAPFKLIVTVNPAILFTSAGTEEICNQTSSNYQITLNVAAVSVRWSRAKVNGIRNAAIANQTSKTIREILYNDTNRPIDVTYVYIAQSGGCTSTTFNLVVTVDPTASVTSASSSTVCSGTALNYTITSNVAGATFRWTRAAVRGISNGAASANPSSSITEALINTTTSPVVARYVITPFYNGCAGNNFVYAVTVNPIPPVPVITAPNEICTGTTLTLRAQTVPGASYVWTGPNNFTSASQNPSIANVTTAAAGDYTVTITLNGCTGVTTTKTIAVDVQPVAAAGPDMTLCAGFPVQLSGTITGGLTTGVWSSTGTGTFSPSNTALNAVYDPSAADVSLPSLTFTLASSALANCSISTSKMTVTLIPAATADAGGNQNICNQNTSVTLKGKATNATKYRWTTNGTGVFSTPADQLTANYVMSADDLKNGSVKFTFTTSNDHCEAYDSKIVRFLPPPVVKAGKDLNYVIRNTLFKLTPYVNETNVKYLWSPPDHIDNDTAKNANFIGLVDETLTLTVTDTLGCVSSDKLSFIVLDPIVTYNTFTPNGDGRNDLWEIPSIYKYPGAVVDIFNRYGVQMFHSNGYTVPWDGTYNGQPVPVGVYYYVITTKFSSQVFSGYVTVLR